MATVILGTVGRLVGGSLGGLIGTLAGQSIDAAILGGGKTREGPRLKELGIQTSSYGASIPAIYGAVRVAGTVIWATDLKESRSKTGGGKGRPKTVEYAYSVSMAVALSSRPLARIGRIWADGNLLRGQSGDFKSRTVFRFYDGHDDQPIDPLIASALGPNFCPAFRGLSYAVFEDLQLADFGNRIPSLSFEIFERESAVPLTDITDSVSAGQIISESQESLIGYALEGEDGRAALTPLLNNFPVILTTSAGKLVLYDWSSASLHTAQVKPVLAADSQTFKRPQQTRDPAGKLPEAIAIRYYDPARDFQMGLQRSQRVDAGRVALQIELPASLDADSARRLADLQLSKLHFTRELWSGYVALDENEILAGDYILDPNDGARWQVTDIEHSQGVSKISARRPIGQNSSQIISADPGTNLTAPDIVAGQTRMIMMDLPILNSTEVTEPIIAIAANGTAPGWRSAALSLRSGEGLSEVGLTAAPATIGSVIGQLAPHSPYVLDQNSRLEVQLLHDQMEIPSGDGNPLSANANLCWVGGEIIRAGKAQYVGASRYILSELQRGCYGTESTIYLHQQGEDFVLLEQETLRTLDNSGAAFGSTVALEALGAGDAVPAAALLAVDGNALRPRAPVHGNAALLTNGDIQLNWIRRVRSYHGWNDGVDVPLFEEKELYIANIIKNGSIISSKEAAEPVLLIAAAERAAWGLTRTDTLSFEICQIGRHAKSAALTINIGANIGVSL
jgi:Putative phage tail protein